MKPVDEIIVARLTVKNTSPETLAKVIAWLKKEAKFLEENNVAREYSAKCILIKKK
jgi:hypothetical protein